MGFYFVTGECFGCHRLFTFHPHKVPSIVIDGERRPICRSCIEKANPLRIAKGLDPIQILSGAYDPAEEGEI